MLDEGVVWGDSGEWLPALPANSVDLFFTSPPSARLLGEQPGTVGYVVHHRGVDGSVDGWAVFEEILSPMRLLHFAEQDARR